MPKAFVLRFVHDAGLGNQLFEWAAGYGIAKKLGLPYRWVWEQVGKRKYGLGAFGIPLKPAPSYKLLVEKPGQGTRADVERATTTVANSEEDFPAVSSPFQALECFEDVADEIRGIFKLESLTLKVPAGCTPVSVQVRRTDYLGRPRLNVVTEAYFERAMHLMREKVENPHFFFTSDDLKWCELKFGKRHDVTIMPPHSEVDGLRMMGACKGHIISNSTYGWWGAWLADSGPVMVPLRWHNQPGSYGDWNPILDHWIKVGGIRKDNLPPHVDIRHFQQMDPLPQTDRAIVIPWKHNASAWQELRYCLRSIDKFFEDKECPIFVLGTERPGFLLYDNGRVTYTDTWSYWEALNNGVQLARKIAWFNDDTLLLKPTTWDDIAVPYYVTDIRPDFLEAAGKQHNSWRAGMVRAVNRLNDRGITKWRLYSTHIPYVYEREKAVPILKEFGMWDKFPMEMAYFHLHPDGSRKLTNEKTMGLPFGDAQFLNLPDKNIAEDLKQALRELLPDYAPWELARKFE